MEKRFVHLQFKFYVERYNEMENKDCTIKVPGDCRSIDIEFMGVTENKPGPFFLETTHEQRLLIRIDGWIHAFMRQGDRLASIQGIRKLKNLSRFSISGIFMKFFWVDEMKWILENVRDVKLAHSLCLPETLHNLWLWKTEFRNRLIGIYLALEPLNLPIYPFMWICDWLYGLANVPDIKKVTLLESLQRSTRKIRAQSRPLLKAITLMQRRE